MKRFIICMVLVLITVTLATVMTGCDYKKQPREVTTVDSVEVTTIVEDTLSPEEAAINMLQFQQIIQEDHKYDSTFRSMPKEIVTIIAMRHPEFSNYDLTKEYLNRKEFYDSQLQDFKDLLKFNKPDSIPAKTKEDTPTSSDTAINL